MKRPQQQRPKKSKPNYSKPNQGKPSHSKPGPLKLNHRPGPRPPQKEKALGRLVIGYHSVREALKVRPQAAGELSVIAGHSEESQGEIGEILNLAKKYRLKLKEVSRESLDRLGSGHQGVCLQVLEDPQFSWASLDSGEPQRLLILDEISDPHNLGAILRTAWLLGARALFVSEARSAHLTPTVTKVASGGAEHVPLVVESNLGALIKNLKEKGFWIYGLAGESQDSLYSTEFAEKTALVLGSEGKGLRVSTSNACDVLLSIPQVDAQASFNASVAAGLALGELFRQHSQFGKV